MAAIGRGNDATSGEIQTDKQAKDLIKETKEGQEKGRGLDTSALDDWKPKAGGHGMDSTDYTKYFSQQAGPQDAMAARRAALEKIIKR
jgi:hypothetical protein